MQNVTEPIVIDAKGDVETYENLHDAELDMEPIDVENGEFKVYDAQGLVLIPKIHQVGIHVYLEVSSPVEYRREQLTEILRHTVSYIVRKWPSETVEEEKVWRMDLDELILFEQEFKQSFKERKAKLGWRWWWPWGKS